MSIRKKDLFARRRTRVRNRLKKVARGRLRLSVHRSNLHISAQLIDDDKGVTLASASSRDKSLGLERGSNVAAATKVGAAIAEKAREAGIAECYFDRGAFLYHGRVRALAEAAREGGLRF
ncbi:MAG: 50S ribosomal protein L18 [Albidovulum sp.]|nr:50S ribosomal protein L18 [Albidovulum sp.]MDE0304859.1 50S ribosomal protein L18 [Albidovulum sp.]MDE0530127.1 50S ribosomal protein L18 [Albidovulum sp.]